VISIDTNVLFAAMEASNPDHARAATFVESLNDRDDVVLSEFVLLELYVVMRNPTVLRKPLTAARAAATCEAFRNHPRWQVVGFPPESRRFHDAFWPRLRRESFARRRVFDGRVALTLLELGVTRFATVNTKDFDGFGFAKVWNPLDPDATSP
jgi:uncharacterized protein